MFALSKRGESGRQQSALQRVGVDHDKLAVLLPGILHRILRTAGRAFPAYGQEGVCYVYHVPVPGMIATTEIASGKRDHVVCLFQQVKIAFPPGFGPMVRLPLVRDHADQSDMGTGRLLQQQR